MKLASYRTVLPLTKRFWGVAFFLFFAMGTLGYQMRHLYRYGSERDNAVDVYELFRQSAASLRKRYALVRDSKVPWSVRYNDVSQMGDRSLFLLRRLHTMLGNDAVLSKTRFVQEVRDLIHMEEAYQKRLSGHVNLAADIAKMQGNLTMRMESLVRKIDQTPLRTDKVARMAKEWLSEMIKMIAHRPLRASVWSQLSHVPVRESDYKGRHKKTFGDVAAQMRTAYHGLMALKEKSNTRRSREALTESERDVYKKLFALSDGVAGVLTMREEHMPQWRMLFLIVGLLTFSAFLGMLWFVRGQRQELRQGMANLEEALSNGNDSAVPEEFLPILGKMRDLQSHQITTVSIKDQDVEEWVRSVLRYNNEIRQSVIGLRDGLTWQKINSLEPANDDMRHVLRQFDVQEEVFSAMDEMIASLEEGKLRRRHVREIVRTMRKVKRFYGDVLPGTLKYASESFRRAERRMDETVRIMNLLIHAYDNLRECLPKQMRSIVQERTDREALEDSISVSDDDEIKPKKRKRSKS